MATAQQSSPLVLSECVADVCRQALCFDDVISLASMNAPGFRLVTHDVKNNIRMYTATVDASPIHMMKACVTLPCASEAFLRYLDFDIRCLWDEHFIEGIVLSKLSDAEVTNLQKGLMMSNNGPGASSLGSSSTTAASAAKPPSSFSSRLAWTAPVTVQLKHIGFLAPVPLLADRDFELVVAESFDHSTGVAILKALSPPINSIYASSNSGRKYVRGIITLSGFIATPVTYVDSVLGRDVHGCNVTYIALVHPMGLIPPTLVNIVVGKQTAGLQQLQTFMRQNPIATLPQKKEGLGFTRVLRENSPGFLRRKSKL